MAMEKWKKFASYVIYSYLVESAFTAVKRYANF